MSFFSPLNLLWLLPFVGTLLALYFLRPRRRNLLVSSLYLWNALPQSSRSDQPFQKLKASLLLFLQLLALVLLLLALAMPFSHPFAASKAQYVLVLDQSISMKTSDVFPSRFVEAQRSAEQFVRNSLHQNDTACVVGAGPVPELLCQATSKRGEIIDAIESATPYDEPASIADALVYAHAVCPHATEIILWSDGNWDAADDSGLIQRAVCPIRINQIGTASPVNTGIASLSARSDESHPDAPPKILVTISRQNSQGAQLKIELNSKRIATADVPAGSGVFSKIFSVSALREGGTVTASLSGMERDDLSADNVSTLVVKPGRVRKILLVTAGDSALERGLALLPNVDLYEVSPSKFSDPSLDFDLVVYDQWLPTSMPLGAALVFGAVSADMPVDGRGDDVFSQQIVDWDEADPLLSYVDLSSVHVKKSLNVEPALWGTVIADLNQTPAIVKGSRTGNSVVWIGFPPADSDIANQIAFPILLSNIVDTLTASEMGVSAERRVGTPIELSSGVWKVTNPAGQSYTIISNALSSYTYAATTMAGTYQVDLGSNHLIYYYNAIVPADIAVKRHPMLQSLNGSAKHAAPARFDLSKLFISAALLIVLIEWLVSNRPLRYTKPI